MNMSNGSQDSHKFTSTRMQQYESVKIKVQIDQTIVSEGSVYSYEPPEIKDSPQQSVSPKTYNNEFQSEEHVNVQIQPVKEVMQVEQLQTETQEDKPFTNNFTQMPSNQRNSLITYKPTNRKLIPITQQSLTASMISQVSSTTTNLKKTHQHKINAFYYDRIGDQQSLIFMEKQNFVKFMTMEIIIPMVTAFIIEIIIMVIQNEIGEYCFVDGVECSSYWIRLWSFFRQQILFKLGIVFCKGHILYQLVLGNKLQITKNGRPLMEYFVLIIMTLTTDFIMIFWVGFNEDWLFIVYVYILGFVVFFNTFRMKTWPTQISKGLSFFFYDITIIGLLIACFLLFPYIKSSLRNINSVAWDEYYFFIYPLLDLGMEVYMDLCLSMTKYSELYIYQGQLLIIGTRVGTLILGNMARFDFWFCLFFLIMFRINNISLVFTVFLRRVIYYAFPDSLKPFVSMEETNLTTKGKNGACWEHLFWIAYFYMFLFSDRTLTHYIYDKSYIVNGKFQTTIWSGFRNWTYMPIIIWGLLLIPEIIGYKLNQSKRYDNIKLLGGNKLKLYENIFIRVFGAYLFNFALMSNLI